MTLSDGGKGDSYRPVNQKKYADNYDRIFNKTSPCVNVCKIEKDVCKGCGRTREQIAQWPYMSDEERQELMSKLGDEYV